VPVHPVGSAWAKGEWQCQHATMSSGERAPHRAHGLVRSCLQLAHAVRRDALTCAHAGHETPRLTPAYATPQ
jgi:hypothetical protein